METEKFPDGFYLCRTKTRKDGKSGATCFSLEKFDKFLESNL